LIYFSNDFGKVLEVGFWYLGGLIKEFGISENSPQFDQKKSPFEGLYF